MTKDQCLEAHSRGQTLRDSGKLSQAREVFFKCAQSSCPALIQGDCARFADEMTRTVPSVSFVARDARGNDVVDTIVFVDDLQVADRLDRGKSIDVDPGEHTVRFLHGDKKVEQKIVVHQGERERLVVGTFPDLGAPPAAAPGAQASVEPSDLEGQGKSNTAIGPIVVMGAGAAALIGGGVVVALGFGKIPSQCSYSSKDCAAPPGDPALADAKSGAQMVNAGFIVGGVGLAAIGGGLLWYFLRKPDTTEKVEKKETAGITPWFDHRSGGVAWSGSF
ncbi:hypothetical protein [Pendulispora albinea]|uniref:Uncharacterized protein n=1 Tax=Pendulispora albinea TaxID=2741071 RepID=A0ABZ2M931_9BACT